MIFFPEQGNKGIHNGSIEPGMVICVEAYAGKIGGAEGVKLEEQILILEDGLEVLTQFPFEQRLMV